MSGQRVHNARISSPHQNGQINPGGVNGCCHGWTAGVQPNQRRVLRNPRVMLIFWVITMRPALTRPPLQLSLSTTWSQVRS